MFLVASGILGLVVAKKFDSKNQIAYAIPLGILVSTWVVFLVSLAIGFNSFSVLFASIVLLAAFWFLKQGWGFAPEALEKNLVPLAVAAIVFLFAINFSIFHYDPQGGVQGFSTDFGFHKSIIASLANGNFPPEHPLFAGKPLSYYYFTHLFSASLIIGGIPLQWTSILTSVLLNLSAVLLLLLVFRAVFPEKKARWWLPYAGALLVLFNGSLLLFELLQKNPPSFLEPP